MILLTRILTTDDACQSIRMNEASTERIYNVSSQFIHEFRKVLEFNLPFAGVVNFDVDGGLIVCSHRKYRFEKTRNVVELLE